MGAKPVEMPADRLGELLREAQSLAGIGAWELDAKTGQVLWTEEVYIIYGLSSEKFNPNLDNALQYYHPDDRSRVEGAVMKAVNFGSPYTLMCRLIRPDGKTRFVKTTGRADTHDGEVIRIFGIIQDITELKETEKLLIESGGITTSLVEAMQEGVTILNADSIQISVNPAFCQMTGYFPEELIGLSPPFPYWPEEFYDEIFLMFDMEPEAGKTLQVTFKRKNGERFEVMLMPAKLYDKDGNLQAYFATVRDIDEEVHTKRQLDQTVYQLKKLTNSVPGAIFQIVRSNEGEIRITYISEGIVAMLPVASAEYLMDSSIKALEIMLGEEQTETLRSMLEESARLMQPFSTLVHLNTGSEAALIQVDAQPEQQSPDWVTWFGYAQDVTRLREQNRMLENLVKVTGDQNNRLLHFAQIVSHNVRSHASNIMGLLDILRESTSIQERELMLDMLGETGNKLDETIRNLNEVLTINRNVNPPKTKVNLAEGIVKVLDFIREELDSHLVRLKVDVPEDLEVHVVPSYLDSILLNLLSNCIKYRSHYRRLEIVVSAEQSCGEVILKVSDNGLGLDMQRYGDQLFGMYRTFHGNPDARGLGLFLIRNQVEAMGGSIQAESVQGEGSVFTVRFV